MVKLKLLIPSTSGGKLAELFSNLKVTDRLGTSMLMVEAKYSSLISVILYLLITITRPKDIPSCIDFGIQCGSCVRNLLKKSWYNMLSSNINFAHLARGEHTVSVSIRVE